MGHGCSTSDAAAKTGAREHHSRGSSSASISSHGSARHSRDDNSSQREEYSARRRQFFAHEDGGADGAHNKGGSGAGYAPLSHAAMGQRSNSGQRLSNSHFVSLQTQEAEQHSALSSNREVRSQSISEYRARRARRRGGIVPVPPPDSDNSENSISISSRRLRNVCFVEESAGAGGAGAGAGAASDHSPLTNADGGAGGGIGLAMFTTAENAFSPTGPDGDGGAESITTTTRSNSNHDAGSAGTASTSPAGILLKNSGVLPNVGSNNTSFKKNNEKPLSFRRAGRRLSSSDGGLNAEPDASSGTGGRRSYLDIVEDEDDYYERIKGIMSRMGTAPESRAAHDGQPEDSSASSMLGDAVEQHHHADFGPMVKEEEEAPAMTTEEQTPPEEQRVSRLTPISSPLLLTTPPSVQNTQPRARVNGEANSSTDTGDTAGSARTSGAKERRSRDGKLAPQYSYASEPQQTSPPAKQ